MSRRLALGVVAYLLIGLGFYVTGYVPGPLSEQVGTLLFLLLGWPLIIGARLIDLVFGSPLN